MARWRFSSNFHFLIDYVTEECTETSHLQCLYPSFNVCCYGPRFTCIQKYGHGQGTHQSDLGADGDAVIAEAVITAVAPALAEIVIRSTNHLIIILDGS